MASYPPLGARTGGSLGPLFGSGWDRAQLGPYMLPGHCRVTKGGVRLKVDQKAKAAAHGANKTYHGLDPMEFELEVMVWTDDQLAELLRVARAVLPTSKDPPPPVSQKVTKKTTEVVGSAAESETQSVAPPTRTVLTTTTVKVSPDWPKHYLLDHPDLLHLGPIEVVVEGCGVLQREGRTRKLVFQFSHHLPTKAKPVKGTPKGPPTRQTPNQRAGSTTNSSPVSQPGAAAPPASLMSGG